MSGLMPNEPPPPASHELSADLMGARFLVFWGAAVPCNQPSSQLRQTAEIPFLSGVFSLLTLQGQIPGQPNSVKCVSMDVRLSFKCKGCATKSRVCCLSRIICEVGLELLP